MITLTENSDNVDVISGDAATGEIIRITASDDAGGERLDRFLADAIAAHNSEDGAPADSHSLSRSSWRRRPTSSHPGGGSSPGRSPSQSLREAGTSVHEGL